MLGHSLYNDRCYVGMKHYFLSYLSLLCQLFYLSTFDFGEDGFDHKDSPDVTRSSFIDLPK